ncbi:hypothetical protein KRMM14A1259_52900 [Krasilnikovia sp. MM14-A1259]
MLLLQLYLTLIVLSIVTMMMSFLSRVLGESRSAMFFAIYVALVGATILLVLSARMFRLGRPLGWYFAVVAELVMLSIVAGAILFGPFVGVAAIILFVVAAWISVNLCRAEVRRFFFG